MYCIAVAWEFLDETCGGTLLFSLETAVTEEELYLIAAAIRPRRLAPTRGTR